MTSSDKNLDAADELLPLSGRREGGGWWAAVRCPDARMPGCDCVFVCVRVSACVFVCLYTRIYVIICVSVCERYRCDSVDVCMCVYVRDGVFLRM